MTCLAGPPEKRFRNQSRDLFDGLVTVLGVVQPLYTVEHAKDTSGVIGREDDSILGAHAGLCPLLAHLEGGLTLLFVWL